jgi:Domain of unknown function (DUF3883)
MDVARERLEADGWSVENVSADRSYDLHCKGDGRELRVEVNGTMGAGASILLTPNEVRHASEHEADTMDKFGRFTRAMNAAGVSHFVDAKAPSEIEPDEPKAYEADVEQMRTLLSYVFGEDGGPPPVFSDTRQVKELGAALASDDGRRILAESRELEAAYEAAGGLRERLLNNLHKALTALQAAGDDLPAHREDDDVRAAIAAVAQTLEALSHGEAVQGAEATAEPEDDEEAGTLDDDWDEEADHNDE